MNAINLTLAFLLELIAFVGFASLGFLLPVSQILQFLAALLLFAGLVTFWGRYMSPRAPRKFGAHRYYIAKFAIYAVAAFAIFQTFSRFGGVVFLLVAIANDLALFRHNMHKGTR